MQLELDQHILNRIAIFLINIEYLTKNGMEVASALRKHEQSIQANNFSLVH